MIKYFKHLFNNFKLLSLTKKILASIFVFLYLTIVALSIIKVNYSVLTPGTPSRVDSLIKVETNNEVGRIYTVSVYEYRRIPILQYLVSKTSNDVGIRELGEQKDIPNRVVNIQGEIEKELSINSAIVMAYIEASKHHESISIEYEVEGFYISQVDKNADKRLKLKDLITHIDGNKIEQISDISSFIQGKTSFTMTIKRDSETIDLDLTLNKDGKIGISVFTFPLYKINQVTPAYEINAEAMASSRGASGGLMQALAIYNAITPYDITKGKTIMGTGTIDVDGNVGKIGGVEQKLYVADKYGADIFFVPFDQNYDEVKPKYDQLVNPKFELVPVNTFNEAVEYLEGLGG